MKALNVFVGIGNKLSNTRPPASSSLLCVDVKQQNVYQSEWSDYNGGSTPRLHAPVDFVTLVIQATCSCFYRV